MTSVQSGNGQGGDDKVAAAWFAGILTLALGGAGLIIAALAVGVERTWAGGAVEQQRARERRGSWLDNQRAWLEQDHRARADRSKAYGAWLNDGADPASMPGQPSWWRRFRDGLRRRVAHTALAGNDFRSGFRDGWHAANDIRRDGGGFRDIVRTRPTRGVQPADRASDVPADAPTDVCRSCGRHGVPVAYDGYCTDCARPARRGTGDDEDRTPGGPKSAATPGGRKPSPRPRTGAVNWPTSGICGKCGQPRHLSAVGWCEPCVLGGEHGFCNRCNGLMIRDGDVFRHGPHQGCTAVAPIMQSSPTHQSRDWFCPSCRKHMTGTFAPLSEEDSRCPDCRDRNNVTTTEEKTTTNAGKRACDLCGQFGYVVDAAPKADANPQPLDGVEFMHHLNNSTACPVIARISDRPSRYNDNRGDQTGTRPESSEGGPVSAPGTICPQCNQPRVVLPEDNICEDCVMRNLETGPIEPDSLRIHPSVGHSLYGDNYDPGPQYDNTSYAANRADRTSTQGDTMTAPAQTATPATTESNATILRGKLLTTNTTLTQIRDLTDQLAAANGELARQVRDADEFASATGQSAQARTALDESNALATSMGERLGEFSQGAVSAEEQMGQASDGLRVAENAEDELRSAGADGRAVAPAGANA